MKSHAQHYRKSQSLGSVIQTKPLSHLFLVCMVSPSSEKLPVSLSGWFTLVCVAGGPLFSLLHQDFLINLSQCNFHFNPLTLVLSRRHPLNSSSWLIFILTGFSLMCIVQWRSLSLKDPSHLVCSTLLSRGPLNATDSSSSPSHGPFLTLRMGKPFGWTLRCCLSLLALTTLRAHLLSRS